MGFAPHFFQPHPLHCVRYCSLACPAPRLGCWDGTFLWNPTLPCLFQRELLQLPTPGSHAQYPWSNHCPEITSLHYSNNVFSLFFLWKINPVWVLRSFVDENLKVVSWADLKVQFKAVPWSKVKGQCGHSMCFRIYLHNRGNSSMYIKNIYTKNITCDLGTPLWFILLAYTHCFSSWTGQTMRDGITKKVVSLRFAPVPDHFFWRIYFLLG